MQQDWVKDYVIPFLTIITSGLISLLISYVVVTHKINREIFHGRYRFLELTRRYFLNLVNALDPSNSNPKNDPLSKKVYVAELKAILSELDDLIKLPYLDPLILEYPNVSRAIVLLRQESVTNEQRKDLTILPVTMVEFHEFLEVLRKNMPKKYVNQEIDKEIDVIYSHLLKHLTPSLPT